MAYDKQIRIDVPADQTGLVYGQDEEGNEWLEFEIDVFAEQLPGECSICGKKIESGFMCLDGAEEVCADHVTIKRLGR